MGLVLCSAPEARQLFAVASKRLDQGKPDNRCCFGLQNPWTQGAQPGLRMLCQYFELARIEAALWPYQHTKG